MDEEKLQDLVDDLFTAGVLGEKAHTLVLMAKDGRKLGGWSREALKQRIRKIFAVPTFKDNGARELLNK